MVDWKRALVFLKRDSGPKPLPTADEGAEKLRDYFVGLTDEQIKKILNVVIAEAEKSRKMGLEIEKDHFLGEEYFFLWIVDRIGGVDRMKICFNFEAAMAYVSAMTTAFFVPMKEYYFKKERGKSGSKLKYSCHLESVKSALLNMIYGDKL